MEGEGSTLLINLAVALAFAWLGAVVSARLRVSPILGYIVAGIIIGPYTPGLQGDLEAVDALADIGVILLMFTVGVDLSLRRLLDLGWAAFLAGGVQVAATLALAFGAGTLFGWPFAEAFCFGAAIAISSSVVTGKLLNERGETGSTHGQIAFAISTVQDLATIGLVIVLRSLGGEHGATPGDVALAIGKALLFLLILVPVGVRLFPWLFERVARLRNREVFALTVAAVALAVASSATLFGLSLALGAFIAGIVVSESELSHRILATAGPLRDIFAGIFFVSVGMLLNPAAVAADWRLALAVIALIMLVKPAVIAAVVRAIGHPWRTGALAAGVMAHSGEFSFLLASTGLTLGILSSDVFALILSGSLVSMIAAPASYRVARELGEQARRRLPPTAIASLVEASPRPPAVILGYGRVGQVIGSALARRGLAFVALDEDPEVVRRLWAQGRPAILGEADNPFLLDQLGLEHARLLIVALPDALATRIVVEHVRSTYPRLPIIARCHSLDEQEHLLKLGVQEAVVGELELALEMTRFALRRFGVSATEIQSVLTRLRARGEPSDD